MLIRRMRYASTWLRISYHVHVLDCDEIWLVAVLRCLILRAWQLLWTGTCITDRRSSMVEALMAISWRVLDVWVTLWITGGTLYAFRRVTVPQEVTCFLQESLFFTSASLENYQFSVQFLFYIWSLSTPGWQLRFSRLGLFVVAVGWSLTWPTVGWNRRAIIIQEFFLIGFRQRN